MKPSMTIAVIAASLALGACSKDEPPKPEPEPAAAAPTAPAPAPTPAPAAEPDPTADQIPIAEDFEDEARQQITPETLRAELDALEKEIKAN